MKNIYRLQGGAGRGYFSSIEKMMEWAEKNWQDMYLSHSHPHYFKSLRPDPFFFFGDGSWVVFEFILNDPFSSSRKVPVEELREVYNKVKE